MYVKQLTLLIYTLWLRGANSFPILPPIKDFIPNAGSLHVEDMVLLPQDDSVAPRSFLTSQGRWPITSENGTQFVYIPYVMVEFDPDVEKLVRKFIDEFTEKSCIRWVPHTDEDHFLTFSSVPINDEPSHICSANVGMSYGDYPQRIIIFPKCIGGESLRILFNIPHEMMHALGFIHEQQRIDRDCYITVNEQYLGDNINYGLYTYVPIDDTFPYDPNSVMQYPSWAGQFTSKFGDYLGPKNHTLSEMDWIKLNYMYCDGPHICETDPEQCEKHKNIQNECGYSSNKIDEPRE